VPAPQTGQPAPAPPYTIRRNVPLVILDVVVTDKQGNTVKSLPQSAFHVTEAKEDQTIRNFEETSVGSEGVPGAIESTADLDRVAPKAPVNIILLDEFNTRFEDMAFARYSLKKFLEKQPDRLTVPTMLLAVSLEKFSVVHDYTQNKQALIDSLDHHLVAFPWQQANGGWVAERYGAAFGALERVAEATQGHEGHKNMIWIGRGFPPRAFSRTSVDADNRVNTIVQRCVNMLRDARVTLYTIDPAGLLVSQAAAYGDAAAFSDPFGGNYQFDALATATGGKALHGRNDVDVQIDSTYRDGANFYTLTYRPKDANLDPNRFRRIKVTVDQPGLTATTREGYYVGVGTTRVDPQKPSKQLAFDLLSASDGTLVYDAVPFTVEPLADDPDTFHIRVLAKGIVWTYATDTQPRHADITLMAMTFDKKGKELKHTADVAQFKAPPTVPPTGRIERDLNFAKKIEHDPRAVRVRFVVRVTQTGHMGTADYTYGQAAAVAPAPAPASAP
jgi:VWFA-related protein